MTTELERWLRPHQVDRGGPSTSTNGRCALGDRPLRFGADRCYSRLLVSAAARGLDKGAPPLPNRYQAGPASVVMGNGGHFSGFRVRLTSSSGGSFPSQTAIT